MHAQIYSDIHLEFYHTFPRIIPQCDTLILTGDIGKLHLQHWQDFMEYCSQKWKTVYYVLGNHEFYHSKKSIQTLKEHYSAFFESYPNICLLDCSTDSKEDILIIGCTLWSYAERRIEDSISDFRAIKYKCDGRTKSITHHQYNEMYFRELEFLRQTLTNTEYSKIIICTHYPTTQQPSNPKYINQPNCIRNYFANEIDFTKYTDKDIVCIAGHTHWSYDFTTDNVLYIANQFGYPNELKKEETGIRENMVYTLF